MQSSRIAAGDNADHTQLNKVINDARGASMLQAHQQDTPDLTVYVEAGILYIGDTPVVFAGGNSPSFTAPATARIDLLCIDSAGTLSVVSGTPGASPVAPAYPTDKVVLWQVYNRSGQTTILDDDDSSNGYIQNDYRPFLKTSGVSAGVVSDLSTTSDGNNDVAVACGFKPKMIMLSYYIQGRINSGAYQAEKGIAFFLGTTLAWNSYLGDSRTNSSGQYPLQDTNDASGGWMPPIPNGSGGIDPYAGNTGDADNARIRLSIESVSSTGFNLRRLVSGYNNGGTVLAKVAWVAYA